MTAVAFPPAGLKLLGTLDRLGASQHATLAPSAFESLLRRPAIAFAVAMNRHLERIAPEYRADPRRIEAAPGQVFRRDRHGVVRRTEMAIDFLRIRTAPGEAAGFQVRIGATGVDIAAGIWQPRPRVRLRLRAWLLTNHHQLEAAMAGDVARRAGPLHMLAGEEGTRLTARTGDALLEQLLMAREMWWAVRLAPSLLTEGELDRVVAGYFRLLAPCVRLLSAAMG